MVIVILLLISQIRYINNKPHLVIKTYDANKKSTHNIRQIPYEKFRDILGSPIVQVIVSSEPSLLGGAFIKEYQIEKEDLIELPAEKRMSIPFNQVLVELDDTNF